MSIDTLHTKVDALKKELKDQLDHLMVPGHPPTHDESEFIRIGTCVLHSLNNADACFPTTPVPALPRYTVEVRVGAGISTTQAAVFLDAAKRWERVIAGALTEIVTDVGRTRGVIIDASGVYIDGAGQILGQAGPTAFRRDSGLPCRGIMQFDSADLTQMERDKTLADVITHEMGHVIGFGTVARWAQLTTGTDPVFHGQNAVREYAALGGSGFVPLANTGGAGTFGSHWRESVFDTELMTGYAEAPGVQCPLSRLTVAALQDLGYAVNYGAADAYHLPVIRARGRLTKLYHCQ